MSEKKEVNAITAFGCENCNSTTITPKKLCVRCGSTQIKPVKCKGEGNLKVFTTVYYPPDSHKDKGVYNIGLVELDDGCKVFGLVEGEPDELSVGARVALSKYDEEKGEISFRLNGR